MHDVVRARGGSRGSARSERDHFDADRRQGVQSALLRFRLHEAARRGCDIAFVTTAPGSKSTENVQKFGFSILYVRAILVKPAPTA
jgi:hypothetical protein